MGENWGHCMTITMHWVNFPYHNPDEVSITILDSNVSQFGCSKTLDRDTIKRKPIKKTI